MHFWGKLMMGFCFTSGMLFLYAILLGKTELSDEYIYGGVQILKFMGVMFASFLEGRSRSKKLWFYGARVGFVYGFVLLLFHLFWNGFTTTFSQSLWFLGIAILFGMLGGLIGGNWEK
jgi:putative membrane protein (TIGR04086 family)